MIHSSGSTARRRRWFPERALPTRMTVTPAMASAVVALTAVATTSDTIDEAPTTRSAFGGHLPEHWATGPPTGSSRSSASANTQTTAFETTSAPTNARSTRDPGRSRGKHTKTYTVNTTKTASATRPSVNANEPPNAISDVSEKLNPIAATSTPRAVSGRRHHV